MMEQKGSRLRGSSLLVPSVQELAKENPTEVPSRYIRHDHDQEPADAPPQNQNQNQNQIMSNLSSEIPIIDMDKLSSDACELHKLHLACKDWGFFQIINHGVSLPLMDRVKEETQEFFELPITEKQKFWQTSDDIEGFGQAFVVSEDQKLDWADMFFLTTLPHHARKPRLFPNLPLPFRETLEEYSRELKTIAIETLLHIARALNMESKDMMLLFEEGMQSMRMNYYPPCPRPEQVIGLTPHSDAVGITFLLQLNDVEGLQIKKDGVWIPIQPLPNAFIVNIGEILEIVTNGQYKSIEHRAIVNSEKERLSIATFYNPNLDGELGPAPCLILPGTSPKFKRVSVADFFKNLFSRELNSKTNLEQYYI